MSVGPSWIRDAERPGVIVIDVAMFKAGVEAMHADWQERANRREWFHGWLWGMLWGTCLGAILSNLLGRW